MVSFRLADSEDAKKLYTHTTAAVLRAKEDIMTTVTNVKTPSPCERAIFCLLTVKSATFKRSP